jgi:hypothetical protein
MLGFVVFPGSEIVRRALTFVCLLSLGGCAGYAADYWRPKGHLIAPQLARYGMSGAQADCVEGRLVKTLSVKQLRLLTDLAGRLQAGGNNPAALTPYAFTYVAGLVRDPQVGAETRSALETCKLNLYATRPGPAAPAPAPRPAPPAASPGLMPGAPSQPTAPVAAATERPPLWVNLGTAPTGQGISIDASGIVNTGGYREAWFRLLNGDRSSVGDLGYRLRIDCAAGTIMALAGRKYAPNGTLIEQKEYPKPEGPMPIEKGTVLELAFRGVCT